MAGHNKIGHIQNGCIPCPQYSTKGPKNDNQEPVICFPMTCNVSTRSITLTKHQAEPSYLFRALADNRKSIDTYLLNQWKFWSWYLYSQWFVTNALLRQECKNINNNSFLPMVNVIVQKLCSLLEITSHRLWFLDKYKAKLPSMHASAMYLKDTESIV